MWCVDLERFEADRNRTPVNPSFVMARRVRATLSRHMLE